MKKKNLIIKTLYGFCRRSPVYFDFNVDDSTISIKGRFGECRFDYNNSENVTNIIHRINDYLFNEVYPKMDNNGTIYVINKINIDKNQILLKRIDKFEEKHKYAVRIKMPIVSFLDMYCRDSNCNPKYLWNKFVENIYQIDFGDDIYRLNEVE